MKGTDKTYLRGTDAATGMYHEHADAFYVNHPNEFDISGRHKIHVNTHLVSRANILSYYARGSRTPWARGDRPGAAIEILNALRGEVENILGEECSKLGVLSTTQRASATHSLSTPSIEPLTSAHKRARLFPHISGRMRTVRLGPILP